MNIISRIDQQIRTKEKELFALHGLKARIRPEGFEVESAIVSCGGDTIDIDNPSRKDVEKILYFIHAGKWNKTTTVTKSTLLYITTEDFVPGYKLRLWNAEIPSTCRLVEEEIEVAAVPAHKETVRRIVCTPDADTPAPTPQEMTP
jgi:hypothetical protein